MSSYHRHRSCQPCCLCGKVQMRYDHFGSLNGSEQNYIQRYHSKTLSDDSCLCRSHKIEVKRYRSNPEHTPTWIGKISSDLLHCTYPQCIASSDKVKIIRPSDDICRAFEATSSITNISTLCDMHYQSLYRTIRYKPCSCCGAIPRPRQGPFTRHSPDAATISSYLMETTEFQFNFNQEDSICKSCYDMHIVLLKDIKKKELDALDQLPAKIDSWTKLQADKSTTELHKAILQTVVFVARHLQHKNALLLPRVSSFFLSLYECRKEDLQLELTDGTINFSSRWLMNQLILYLQPYMQYKCVIKKIGTLLYPSDEDLLVCLTHALNNNTCDLYEESLISAIEEPNESIVTKAGKIINDLLHEEIKKIGNESNNMCLFNLENRIATINSLLWQFITVCTTPIRAQT